MPVLGDIAPFLVFVRPLIDAKLRFMVTGSVAAMVFGEPRLTNEIDLKTIDEKALDLGLQETWIEIRGDLCS